MSITKNTPTNHLLSFPLQIVNYKKQDSTKGEGAFLGEPDAMGYGEDQGQGLDGYGQSPARAFAYNGDGRGNIPWSEICFLLQPSGFLTFIARRYCK